MQLNNQQKLLRLGGLLAFERGGSVVVAAVALPMLLLFLFTVIDLGRVAFLNAEADTAAHAVCRLVEESPQLASQESKLQQAALATSPSLSVAGVELFVAVQVEKATKQAFEYRIYDSTAENFSRLPAHVERRPLKVVVEVRTTYLTGIGTALSLAQGMSKGEFRCRAEARGVIDETIGKAA